MTDAPSGPLPVDGAQAPAVEPVPQRRARLARALAPRATLRQLVIGLLFLVLGFAGVAAARGTTTTGLLATAREDEVVRVLDDLNERQARLEIEQRALVAARDRLASGTEEQRLAASRARADALAILAGTVPATGPGLRVTVEDPTGSVDASVLLDTVQELRDAGAEAIQIASVRVVASTWFDDAQDGVGLVVSGTRLAPPYRIVALGDPTTLATALQIPGGVSDTVRTAGGRITITPETSVLVTALQPPTTPQYARPAATAPGP